MKSKLEIFIKNERFMLAAMCEENGEVLGFLGT